MLGIGTSADVHVVEDFPRDLMQEMIDYVENSDIAWYHSDLTSHPPEEYQDVLCDCNTDDAGQKTHVVILHGRSKVVTVPKFVSRLTEFVSSEYGATTIQRIKFNKLASRNVDPSHYNIPHHDGEVPTSWSMLVYLAGNTGDTVFFNQTYNEFAHTKRLTISRRIQPVTNRVVVFPSRLMHASSSPWDGQDRVVANIVFSVV